MVFILLPYSLVLSGCGGGNSVAITPPTAPKSTVSLSISPSAVMPGQNATLTWASANATSCTASGAWTGPLPLSGSSSVMLQGAAAQTYTINCSGAGLPGQNTATLAESPEGGCTTANAARGHRARLPRAIAAARRAVASGTAGAKKRTMAP